MHKVKLVISMLSLVVTIPAGSLAVTQDGIVPIAVQTPGNPCAELSVVRIGAVYEGDVIECRGVPAPSDCCWKATEPPLGSHGSLRTKEEQCGDGEFCFYVTTCDGSPGPHPIRFQIEHVPVDGYCVNTTPVPTLSPTPSPTATSTPSTGATPTSQPTCVGDCDSSGQVTIDELLRITNIVLGNSKLSSCGAADTNDSDGSVYVDDILKSIIIALDGCP